MRDEDYNIEDLIPKYFMDIASTDELETLKKWIEESPQNKERFFNLKNIWDVSHTPFQPSDISVVEAYDKVMRSVLEEPSVKPKRSFWYYWQRIAAVVLLPLMMLSAWLIHQHTATPVENMETVMCPYGTRSNLTLSDNSQVCLNSGSTLNFPTKFEKNDRVVALNGEAYFEVKSDPMHPFIVKIGEMSVKATGTAFNIDGYDSDSIISVTLVRGKLGINVSSEDIAALSPGQQIIYNKGTHKYSINEVDAYKMYSWKDGVLVFNDVPLEYVFKRLGVVYNIDFVFKDSKISKHLYRATFSKESIDDILSLIEMSTTIKYKEFDRNNGRNDMKNKRRIEIYEK